MRHRKRTTLFDQARVQFESGDFEAAIATCDQFLATRRKDVVALDLKAQACNAVGRHEEAEAAMRVCLSVRPRDVRFLLTLAETMMFAGRFADALDVYARAEDVGNGDVRAVTGSADALEKLGQHNDARRRAEQAVQRGHRHPKLVDVYCRVLLHEHKYERAADLLVQVLHEESLNSEQRRGLLHTLGKSYERLGKTDDAFEAYEKANQQCTITFDINKHESDVVKLIHTFSRDELRTMPRASGDTTMPVFVLGMPRSGTTLVERIVHAHPACQGAGELTVLGALIHDMTLDIGSTRIYPACLLDADQNDVEEFSRKYLGQIRAMAPAATRVIDKNLMNHLHLGMIQSLFPQCRVIYCRRSAEDTCFSCYAEPFAQYAHPYTNDLLALGVVFRAYERLMEHWMDVLELPILEVKYEDLVADQEHWTRRMLDHCGVDWSDDCMRFHEADGVAPTLSYNQVRQPMYSRSIGRARKFHKHLRPLRDALEAAKTKR